MVSKCCHREAKKISPFTTNKKNRTKTWIICEYYLVPRLPVTYLVLSCIIDRHISKSGHRTTSHRFVAKRFAPLRIVVKLPAVPALDPRY